MLFTIFVNQYVVLHCCMPSGKVNAIVMSPVSFTRYQAIGESLFTIFASLAEAIQFLMELQINQF